MTYKYLRRLSSPTFSFFSAFSDNQDKEVSRFAVTAVISTRFFVSCVASPERCCKKSSSCQFAMNLKWLFAFLGKRYAKQNCLKGHNSSIIFPGCNAQYQQFVFSFRMCQWLHKLLSLLRGKTKPSSNLPFLLQLRGCSNTEGSMGRIFLLRLNIRF